MNREDFHCQQCGICCRLFHPGCCFLQKVHLEPKYECLLQGTEGKPKACVDYPFKEDDAIREDQERICPEVRRLMAEKAHEQLH